MSRLRGSCSRGSCPKGERRHSLRVLGNVDAARAVALPELAQHVVEARLAAAEQVIDCTSRQAYTVSVICLETADKRHGAKLLEDLANITLSGRNGM
jgi:hypothetical protein